VAEDRGQKVAIEVRTIRGGSEPIDAIDPAKRRKVRRLAHQTGASRVDFVGIRLESDAVVVHWVPGGV
jgi:Holliday junction resolvase-like predicted endonuclease